MKIRKLIIKPFLFASFLAISLTSSSFADETVNIKSLKLNGSDRNLCITKRSNNIRLKKCENKSAQRFELVRTGNNENMFQLKRKGKCIVAKFNGNLDSIKSNIKNNVKIRISNCTRSNNTSFDGAVYSFWEIDRGNRIRLFEFIPALDICFSDEDKDDKI